jgi:hypothetical protein
MADILEAELDKIAFDLGWDYAIYGMWLDDQAPLAMVEGHRQGQRRGSRKPLDRYIQKFLYLRYGALKRKRAVSEYVTPELIRYITAKYCPITRIELTHGTMTDSDWSIDRINNDGAYAPGNIVVMSTKANHIKANLSAAEITDIVFDMQATNTAEHNGLSLFEWRRLSWLAEKCDRNFPVPFVLHPPRLIHINYHDAFQLYLAASVALGKLTRFKKMCPNKHAQKALMRYAKAVDTYLNRSIPILSHAIHEAYQVPSVYTRLLEFLDEIAGHSEDLFCQLHKVMDNEYANYLRVNNIEDEYVDMRPTWMIESKGYIDITLPQDTGEHSTQIQEYLKRVTKDKPAQFYHPQGHQRGLT